jgi:putative phosphoribosyl transferase
MDQGPGVDGRIGLAAERIAGGEWITRGWAMGFTNRIDAGRRLARSLAFLRGQDIVVLGLPRGGVPVAFQVAVALTAPLDVIMVRKLGVPEQPEFAMGAIGEGGVRIVNRDVVRLAGVDAVQFATVEARERENLRERAARLRRDRPPASLAGRTAVIVDDGVATGSTARAACQGARARGAARVVLAVPVAPADLIDSLRQDADEVICVLTPQWLSAVGQWYEDFAAVGDGEVADLLVRAAARTGGPTGRDDEVAVEVDRLYLPGRLTVPAGASGVVVFAHGSGSSRHSRRNRYVAEVLNHAGLGTLLLDLLTHAEEIDRANVFDIGLLARRLTTATAWLRGQPGAGGWAVGWFGASTGAAAALWAAAEPRAPVAAIVSRGGRPDLARPRLGSVVAPTLLIVGGLDTVVLDRNRAAQAQLTCLNELVIVPGATHLFEESGTLAIAAGHARTWFTQHLSLVAAPGSSPASRRGDPVV